MTTDFISQCRWQSRCYDKNAAYQLQEWFSHWSNTGLKQVLEKVFAEYCPGHQTWRIDTMELDLGDISFDELDDEVPARVEAALVEQLGQFALEHKLAEHPSGQQQITGSSGGDFAFLNWFLDKGTHPWWFREKHSSFAIFKRFAHENRQEAARLIRKLGVKDEIRKRIVWQWQVPGTQAVVRTLEPYHFADISVFADNLLQYKQQDKALNKGDNSEFTQYSWLWILTHLVKERGSVFNAASFVRSTIAQMANHFQLAEDNLLNQMLHAFDNSELSDASPELFQALKLIQKQQLQQENTVEEAEFEPDLLWLKAMLEQQPIENNYAAGSAWRMADLFVYFSANQPENLTRLIVSIGRKDKVRKGLIAGLQHQELNTLVRLLAPTQHEFIISHEQQCRLAMPANAKATDLLWTVILAYLLVEKGSHFNRKQFVHYTIEQIARRTGRDYRLLLEILSNSDLLSSHGASRFELSSILIELRKEHWQSQNHQHGSSHKEWRQLQRFIRSENTGSTAELKQLSELFRDFMAFQPRQLVQLLEAELMAENGNWYQIYHISQRLMLLADAAKISQLMVLFSAAGAGELQRLSEDFTLAMQRQAGSIPTTAEQGQVSVVLQTLMPWQLQQSVFSALLYHKRHSGVNLRCAFIMSLEHITGSQSKSIFKSWLQHRLSKSAFEDKSLTEALRSKTRRVSSLNTSSASSLISQLTRIAADPEQQNKALVWLQQCLQARTFGVLNANQKAKLLQLLQGVWGNDPVLWLNRLQSQPGYRDFAQALVRDFSGKISRAMASPAMTQHFSGLGMTEVAHRLEQLLIDADLWRGSRSVLNAQLQQSLLGWALSLDTLAAATNSQSLYQLVLAIAWQLRTSPSLVVKALQNSNVFSSSQSESFTRWFLSVSEQAQQPDTEVSSDLKNVKIDITDTAIINECLQSLFMTGQIPVWVDSEEFQLQAAIEVLLDNPTAFKDLFLRLLSASVALRRFVSLVDINVLLGSMQKALSEYQQSITSLADFYQILQHINAEGIPSDWLKFLTGEILLQFWQNPVWAQRIASHYLGEIESYLIQHSHSSPEAISGFRQQLASLAVLQSSANRAVIEAFLDTDESFLQSTKANLQTPELAVPYFPDDNPILSNVAVNNAGLVLLQGFVPVFFQRLELLSEQDFVSSEMQRKAVHFLQFLASGNSHTEEPYLALNKLMCGLPVNSPVEAGIDMQSEHIDLCESLLGSVVGHWSAIGYSSIEGFRGNWLIRDGILTESKDRWDLVIEKRPYDVLLDRLPFSFSIVNFHWMPKPLYVTWPT